MDTLSLTSHLTHYTNCRHQHREQLNSWRASSTSKTCLVCLKLEKCDEDMAEMVVNNYITPYLNLLKVKKLYTTGSPPKNNNLSEQVVDDDFHTWLFEPNETEERTSDLH